MSTTSSSIGKTIAHIYYFAMYNIYRSRLVLLFPKNNFILFLIKTFFFQHVKSCILHVEKKFLSHVVQMLDIEISGYY